MLGLNSEQFCREHNRPMLLELYYQEDNFQEEGNTRIADSYEDEVGICGCETA